MADHLFVNLDGQLCPQSMAPSSASDDFRLRYGVYETYLARKGMPEYAGRHWKRLVSGLRELGFSLPETFTDSFLMEQIRACIEVNALRELARVRLQVFRKEQSDTADFHYLIEVFPIPESMTQWLPAGIRIAVLPDFVKEQAAADNYKISHNRHFLPARAALESGLADDVLLLNAAGNVVESPIANLFLIKDGMYVTPPLSEGCLDGTIRALILETLAANAVPFREAPLTIADLLEADELFLCNSIRKIRAVREFQGRQYACLQSESLYQSLFLQ